MTTPLPRDAFDLDPQRLWIMHCAEGPVPRAAVDAVSDVMRRELRPWTMRWKEEFLGLPARVRELGATVLGATPPDMTLVPTTSSGLIVVAHGFPWGAGDEVLAPAGEFPSNVWPWRARASRGVTFREVPLWDGHTSGTAAWESTAPSAGDDPEARLLEAIGPKTRLVAASWVRFQDGLALDLGRLARGCAERGVPFVVDGIQGAGTAVPALAGVAAFATGGHKGLLGPQGLGLLWTDPAFRESLVPGGGWLAVEDATNFDRPNTDFTRGWRHDGARLEDGVPNLLGAAAFAASLQVIVDAGVPAISAHVRRLQRSLLHALAGRDLWADEVTRLGALLEAGRLGPILSIHHGGRGPEFLAALLRKGADLGIYSSVREGYLRIALHGWHDENDLERLVDWLAS